MASGAAPGVRMGPYRAPLTESQREALKRTGGCFKCRRRGHIAVECPGTDREWKENTTIETWKEHADKVQIKEEVLAREMPRLEDAENTSEPSNYHSVPSICIPARVKNTLMNALIDCGAEGDLISERVVKKENLPTSPIKPTTIGQALQGSTKARTTRTRTWPR